MKQAIPRPQNRVSQVHPFFRWVGRSVLRAGGWRIDGIVPDIPKFVAVLYPHTTNWDFVWWYATALAWDVTLGFTAKDSLFKGPVGWFLRLCGAIPIDRSTNRGVVEQMIDQFNSHETLLLAVPPEGTRGFKPYWKTGFYYIATGAGVPLFLASINYAEKSVILGPTMQASGDLEADLVPMREFFAQGQGKYPASEGTIAVQLSPEAVPEAVG